MLLSASAVPPGRFRSCDGFFGKEQTGIEMSATDTPTRTAGSAGGESTALSRPMTRREAQTVGFLSCLS